MENFGTWVKKQRALIEVLYPMVLERVLEQQSALANKFNESHFILRKEHFNFPSEHSS